jgi:hypothetical protein
MVSYTVGTSRGSGECRQCAEPGRGCVRSGGAVVGASVGVAVGGAVIVGTGTSGELGTGEGAGQGVGTGAGEGVGSAAQREAGAVGPPVDPADDAAVAGVAGVAGVAADEAGAATGGTPAVEAVARSDGDDPDAEVLPGPAVDTVVGGAVVAGAGTEAGDGAGSPSLPISTTPVRRACPVGVPLSLADDDASRATGGGASAAVDPSGTAAAISPITTEPSSTVAARGRASTRPRRGRRARYSAVATRSRSGGPEGK